MKRLILASTALALMSASAFAADLPARTMAPAAPFVSPPMFTWTGFYVGVNAGWTRSETEASNRGFSGTGGAGAYPTIDIGGRNDFTGGAQVGYNQQFGMFVGGIEADINYMGDRSSTRSAAVAGIGGITTATARSSLDWLGTVRLRAGVAFDRAFIYGTGGLAFGAPNQRLTISGPAGATHIGSDDDMRAGWTLGGGAEYAFTDSLTLKAEYLYYDLGRTTVTATPTAIGPAGTSNSARFDNQGHIARVGVNYKF